MSDANFLREFLQNAHRVWETTYDCPALEEEVLTYPDRCDCGVKDALAALDRIEEEIDYYKALSGIGPVKEVVARLKRETAALRKVAEAAEELLERIEDERDPWEGVAYVPDKALEPLHSVLKEVGE